MKANILDGRALAHKIVQEVAAQARKLKEERGIQPGLGVILVGEDPASMIYVRRKIQACRDVGFFSYHEELPSSSSEESLLERITALNVRPDIHGVLVQLPLPPQMKEQEVVCAIDPCKDVDAFHPVNRGKLVTSTPTFLPCTPLGVLELLKDAGIPLSGSRVVVVGRSNIVGKPAGLLFLREDATVTYCHSKTRNLKEVTSQADILIVAMGHPEAITADYVREGAVVVDVGINRKNGKVVGDVKFQEVAEKASWISPVPGGVGPMTIAMLLKNTLLAATRSCS